MADTLIQADIPVDPNLLFRSGNKIVHPMTLTENDDGQYLVFKIDFDGTGQTFLESEHKLDIAISKGQDVTIPLLVDYPTDTPQDITQLSFALFDRYQYYQFAIDMLAKSVLVVETPDMTAGDMEITIANKAIATEQPVWKSNPNSQTGAVKGWYFDVNTFVVVQIKVPIGLAGTVLLGQRTVTEPLMGISRSTSGKLAADNSSSVLSVLNRNGEDRLILAKPTSLFVKPTIQLFDEIVKGQAISGYNVNGIYFAQNIEEVRDYRLASNTLYHRQGKTGSWLFVDALTGKGYSSQTSPGITPLKLPVTGMSMYGLYTIFEFVTGGVYLHYYVLDDNLVPLTYSGNSFVPWVYDESKPISVILPGSAGALGTAYDVAEGDLGPLRTDFILSHNYDVVVTDVTEV